MLIVSLSILGLYKFWGIDFDILMIFGRALEQLNEIFWILKDVSEPQIYFSVCFNDT